MTDEQLAEIIRLRRIQTTKKRDDHDAEITDRCWAKESPQGLVYFNSREEKWMTL